MQNYNKTFISLAILGSLLMPSVTFASWYNPFSWFNKKPNVTTVTTQDIYNKKIEPLPKTTNEFPDDFYKVVKVVDGDTIKVNIDGKIETLRLIGIDTPETVDPRKVVQCFGKEASNQAKSLLTNTTVRLESDVTQGEYDKYGRLLRYVFMEDGTFYNKLMIENGYAHEYTYQSNPYKYQADFKEAEKNARLNEKGLWSKNTCNGDTKKAATGSSKINTTLIPETKNIVQDSINEPLVKKSSTGICHEKGVSVYYNQTKKYQSYSSVSDCLASGGRLPKN